MAEEEELEGPDLETLQAQIDMSMALTQNIVSGWMKSSKAKLPSSSSRNEDRDIEEYMRKPARLGVGAVAPEATGVLSRESAKLRNKLAGKSKKRERDDEDGPFAAGTAGTTALSDEDEEDSRARVIKKKARIDPFAKGDSKKKKKKAKGDLTVANPGKADAPPQSKLSATTRERGKDVDMEDADEIVGDEHPQTNEPAMTAPSKKKKKKHKAAASEDGMGYNRVESSAHDAATSSMLGKNRAAGSIRPTEGSSGTSNPLTHFESKSSAAGTCLCDATKFALPLMRLCQSLYPAVDARRSLCTRRCLAMHLWVR
ncbi:hypothetical protein BC628DRAFT_1377373 [Trametes gibbosa]|nr:hypothetical protein BC628DRAFT_1377373 [Trametes gibbosa]